MYGATQLAGANTWQLCTAGCTNAAPQCFAADFNTVDNTCWLHSTAAFTASPYSFTLRDHYRRLCNGKLDAT